MQAIIFDLDGTLLDVRESFYWQYQELTKLVNGAPTSREMITAAAHQGKTEQIINSLVRTDRIAFDDIVRQHKLIRTEAHNRYLKLYDGADQLLPMLRNMGFVLAAYTTDDQITQDDLRRLGIHQHFDVIIMGDHVTHAKPHPEGVDLILRRLGVDARNTAIVGDTVVDILVGRNAELAKTIGVTHGFGNVSALHAAGADHVVHDIPSILDVLE
ncbi:MAG TPA: HAD family hydrolase [Candidatus Saccharimonadales bacterium]|nr:HAD family hydrolase [Candidatus Saccharimonadales bacterium]